MRKPTFGVSDLVKYKSTCTVTEKDYIETCHEMFDSRTKGIFIHDAKIIKNGAVTVRLTCAFVFAHVKSGFLMNSSSLTCPKLHCSRNLVF